MMQLTHNTIGRIIQSLDPVMVNDLVQKYTPLSDDITLVPVLYEAMIQHFPDLPQDQERTLFIAIVYMVYAPMTFLPNIKIEERQDRQAVAKLPVGIRSQIYLILGLTFPEEVNRYKTYADPRIKNPRFRAKIKVVTDAVGLTSNDGRL